MENNSSNFLSLSAACVPFGENNEAVRNIFSCVKCRQAIGFSFPNNCCRSDVKHAQLIYPQSPIIYTDLYADLSLANYPIGTNVVIAVLSYSGYDMEDSVVLHKSSVERGLMQDILHQTVVYALDDLAAEYYCGISDIEFKRNPNIVGLSEYLDLDGLPYVGRLVHHNTPILSIYVKTKKEWKLKTYTNVTSAYVVCVRYMGRGPSPLPAENKKLSISFSIKREPKVGDKFSNMHGQKGICSALFSTEDMPFSASGMVPDVLFNPHGLPSRMTIGMMLEIMASKTALVNKCKHSVKQFYFSENRPAFEEFASLLTREGFDYYGCEKFYSGVSGEELEADVFCGSINYLRFHHIVEEKYQVVSVAEADPKTLQPLNVSRSGAVRVGEMERDALLSHGAAELVLDRLLLSSDKCYAFICLGCNTLLYPVIQDEDRTTEENKECRVCDSKDSIRVRIPYVLTYLVAELAVVGVKVKFSAT